MGLESGDFQTKAKEFVIMNPPCNALEALALPTQLLQLLTIATNVGS